MLLSNSRYLSNNTAIFHWTMINAERVGRIGLTNLYNFPLKLSGSTRFYTMFDVMSCDFPQTEHIPQFCHRGGNLNLCKKVENLELWGVWLWQPDAIKHVWRPVVVCHSIFLVHICSIWSSAHKYETQPQTLNIFLVQSKSYPSIHDRLVYKTTACLHPGGSSWSNSPLH